MAKQLRKPIAGFDCCPPHDYPPACICSDDLCTEWVAAHAVPDLCSSEHAHEPHHWWPAGGPYVYSCAGRQFCDPKFMAQEGLEMSVEIDRSKIKYLSLDEATTEPGDGFWNILADRWWSYEPGKGLLFYRKSPQCNSHEAVARKITEQCHPDAEVIFVPRVYLRHDCSDYLT